MNEFIEKLKEKLSRNNIFRTITNSEGKNVFEIIEELAEEYSHCTLCYLQGPCEYQNENVQMPMEYWERGWIPCENELPKETECYLVTYRKNGELLVDAWYFNGRNFNEVDEVDVLAWKPLPKPFNPKVE